jgi:arylsulfatase A-like enzyme
LRQSLLVPAKPNILWILTTQWRASATGYAGDPDARTPHLDALAARSLVFSQAITPHPFGPFARAALLTGVESPANGLRSYWDPLPRDATTLAHRLGGEAGYATAFIGKWHLSQRDRHAPLVGEPHARQRVAPEDRGGFAFWEGFESGFLLNNPWLHGTALPSPHPFPGYQSDVLCDRASAWLASARGHWFCVLSLEAPHPPYDAPAAGISPRDPASLTLAPNVPTRGDAEAKARRELSGYHAHLEATDRALGRLLAHPALDDTLVVFTSVHGDMHGAHGLFRKGWPHEESLRVPLLVRPPLTTEAPAFLASLSPQVSQPISLLALHDWTLRWAGLDNHAPSASACFGLSRCSMPSAVELPLQCDRPWTALRTADRKLVLNADGSPWLLFDLRADPWENTDLSGHKKSAAEISRLRLMMG